MATLNTQYTTWRAMASDSSPDVRLGVTISVLTAHGPMTYQHVLANAVEGVIVTSTAPLPSPVPIRVQSSCVFSEALSAVDCDCASQLDEAIRVVAREGGYVIYLFEEGRGAGLELKFKAIERQQTDRIDTAAAFAALGLPPDLRDHSIAAHLIRTLVGTRPIELLTNDPRKVSELAAQGVTVERRRALVTPHGQAAEDYLVDKAHVLGHIIDASWAKLTDRKHDTPPDN